MMTENNKNGLTLDEAKFLYNDVSEHIKTDVLDSRYIILKLEEETDEKYLARLFVIYKVIVTKFYTEAFIILQPNLDEYDSNLDLLSNISKFNFSEHKVFDTFKIVLENCFDNNQQELLANYIKRNFETMKAHYYRSINSRNSNFSQEELQARLDAEFTQRTAKHSNKGSLRNSQSLEVQQEKIRKAEEKRLRKQQRK
jgi:hypothetical protein